MREFLQIGVLVSIAWALVALIVQFRHAKGYGRREYFAPSTGDPVRGVAYAFGPGMSPTAKESTRQHLPVYLSGVGYHLGVFASFASLVLLIAGISLGGISLQVIRILSLLGAACGIGFLLRRVSTSHLRSLSCPDDVLANLLTTAFVGLACARTFSPAMDVVFMAAAIVLLLYIPLGKIRHCLFFFAARYHTGIYFGRRGTLPPAA